VRPAIKEDFMAKDYRSILGVQSGASKQDIRKAYLARSRVVHPDRFDKDEQPAEWALANEMLRELNEAYAQLKDNTPAPPADGDNNCAPPPGLDERGRRVFFAGATIRQSRVFMFDALTGQDRERILESIQSDTVFSLPVRATGWRARAFGLCLVLCGVAAMTGLLLRGQPLPEAVRYLVIAGLALFHLFWRCLYWVDRARRRIVEDGVRVTSLYFILTSYGEVRFCPIERILGIDLERERVSGGQRRLDASFRTDGIDFRFCINGGEAQENLLRSVNAAKKAILDNQVAANGQFFMEKDMFRETDEDSLKPESAFTSKRALMAAAMAMFLTLALMAGPFLYAV
jgi:hypothetical protein